jgi:hypothetical protein
VTPLAAVYTLDPATGVTLALNGIAKGRVNHQQWPLDGTRVLLVGGSENGNVNTSTLLYDTAGGGSAAAVNVPYGFVWDCQGAPLKDGRIFLYEEGDNLIYAPATDSSTAKGTFGGDYRAFHTMTTLADGKVLLSGGVMARIGVSPAPVLDSAALYDPTTNTLDKLTAKLSTPRKAHTATLLGDGTVLIVGGLGDSGGGLATAELFDPQTRAFSPPIPLNYGRYAGFTATRLQDGNVLIAGRTTSSNPGSQGVCEIYSVAQKKFLATGALVRTRNGHTATLLPTGRVLFVGGNGAETAAGQALTEVFIP